jgi:uncharacterized damage-inducible protein DinB
MNADAFRHFYEYHFTENRKLWDKYISSLTYEQFTQNVDYSHGSIRNQIVHLMNVDELWFNELQNIEFSEFHSPANMDDRKIIRAHWGSVEQNMRDYLASLKDDTLSEKPITQEEDKDLIVWQVLLHVVNHGTDHRAQLLRILHDLGVKTESQDYIFFVYDNP